MHVKRDRPFRWTISWQQASDQAICLEKDGLETASVGLCQVWSESPSSSYWTEKLQRKNLQEL